MEEEVKIGPPYKFTRGQRGIFAEVYFPNSLKKSSTKA